MDENFSEKRRWMFIALALIARRARQLDVPVLVRSTERKRHVMVEMESDNFQVIETIRALRALFRPINRSESPRDNRPPLDRFPAR